MSMWEIEALAESAVRLVAATADEGSLSAAERRSFYANLYTLQEQYDCSYTHFRCLDPLLRDGFMHRAPLEAHPAFAEKGEAVRAEAEGSGWLHLEPGERKSPVVGLYTSPKSLSVPGTSEPAIYFDSRSPLLGHAAAAGHVPAEAATPPETWSGLATIARTMLVAGSAPDLLKNPAARAVLKAFYGFGALHLGYQPNPVTELDPDDKDHELLREAFTLPYLKEVLLGATEDWIDERFPPPRLAKPDESAHMNPAFVQFWRTPLDG